MGLPTAGLGPIPVNIRTTLETPTICVNFCLYCNILFIVLIRVNFTISPIDSLIQFESIAFHSLSFYFVYCCCAVKNLFIIIIICSNKDCLFFLFCLVVGEHSENPVQNKSPKLFF